MSVPGEIDVCADCGAVLWTEKYDALMKLAYEKFKKENGLLSSDEIRQIRENYDLSQDLFAMILGIGSASLQRYETGAVQTLVYDGIIREARNAARLLELLEKNKNNVNPKDYTFAKTKIESSMGFIKISPLKNYLDYKLISDDTPSEWNGNRIYSYGKFIFALVYLISRQEYKEVNIKRNRT